MMTVCRPFLDAEYDRIMLSFHGRYAARDRALFTLGLCSGFRISELLSVRVGQIVQQGRVVDYVTVTRRHMKHRVRSRTVPLHPLAQQALRTWLLELAQGRPLAPETYVFQSRNGPNQPITRRRALRLLQARCRALGMTGPLGTHSMRKTFALHVHKRLGNDLRKTQEALGHRHILSTIRYLPVQQEDIDEAIRGLEFGGRPRLAPEGHAWPGIRREGAAEDVKTC